MHSKRLSKALLLVSVLVLAGLIAGCGGGEQSGGGGNGGDSGGEQQGGGQGDAPQRKIAIGTVRSVEPDKRVITLRAIRGQQEAERMSFKVRKNARVTLDGAKAELSGAKEGQQAQIEYIAKDKLDRAVSVQLFAAGGQPAGEGEGTG